MTKNIIKTIASKRWYLLLLGVLLSTTSLSLAIILKTNPKKKEKFSLFISLVETSVKTNEINEQIKSLNDFKEVTITAISPDSSLYDNYYQTYGKTSDILVVREDLYQQVSQYSFMPIPEKYQSYSGEEEYGILLNGAKNYWEDYLSYDDNKYYLCINDSSVHKDTYCLDLLEVIFNV